MILIIFATIISIILGYKLYESWSDKLKHIRQPWSWPFFKHYPYFWKADHLLVYEQFAKDYKQDGLFRINNLTLPEQVVLLDPEFPKYVLSHPETFVRSDLLDKAVPLYKNGLLLARGEAHKWQRKILSRAFTPEKLRSYMVTSNKHAKILIENWLKKDGENIQVLKYFQLFSFEIVSEGLCNYKTGDALAKNEFTKACNTVLSLINNSNAHLLLRLFPFLKHAPFGPGQERRDAITYVERVISKILMERKEKISNNEEIPDDFLSCMLLDQIKNTNTSTDDQVFTDKHIRDNLFTFLLGGYETTSTALTWILYALALYPDVQEKAREEVKNILEERDDVKLEDINAMRYLTNVIKETLRVYNSSIRVGRIATKDCKIGEYFIPKNQMIKTVFNLFHMNEELFPQPNEFRPERFDEKENVNKAGSWLAFGYGPYSCIGKKFAMNEMLTCVARLLMNFKFTVDEDKRCFIRQIQLTVTATPPATIRIHKLTS